MALDQGKYLPSPDHRQDRVPSAKPGPILPGGRFGWNLYALDDCLRGRWGAMPPFRLIWHHAEVARRHLVPGYNRPAYTQRTWGPAITLQDLLAILTEGRVDVDLR